MLWKNLDRYDRTLSLLIRQFLKIMRMNGLVIDIENPSRNPLAAGLKMGRWLDRDVSAEAGRSPDFSITGVPRVRGIKNKYTLVHTQPVVGVRLRKHWRQREAISKAALELLYDTPEEQVVTAQQQQQLLDKLKTKLRGNHNHKRHSV